MLSPAFYVAIAIYILYFIAGSVVLFRDNRQLVWGLATLELWTHFALFLRIEVFFRSNSISDDAVDTVDSRDMQRIQIFASAVILGIGALASTSLLCIGAVYGWELLFIEQFMFLECMSLWAITSPLVTRILREKQERDNLARQSQSGSIAFWTPPHSSMWTLDMDSIQ
jgi:hypothetical protein